VKRLARAEQLKQNTNSPGGTQPRRILKASAELNSIERIYCGSMQTKRILAKSPAAIGYLKINADTWKEIVKKPLNSC